jgi:hypothetical protein
MSKADSKALRNWQMSEARLVTFDASINSERIRAQIAGLQAQIAGLQAQLVTNSDKAVADLDKIESTSLPEFLLDRDRKEVEAEALANALKKANDLGRQRYEQRL